jgi:hypothetical protein
MVHSFIDFKLNVEIFFFGLKSDEHSKENLFCGLPVK